MAELTRSPDEAIADAIAERVAEKLRNQHVIPATIPAELGEQIAEHARAGGIYWANYIPLTGANSIGVNYTMTAEGNLHIELRRADGHTVWRGTLAPPGRP